MDKERYSTYVQNHNYDCGAGAAAIVLLNFGASRVNYDSLMSALNVRRSGTDTHRLERYFKRRGFEVVAQENSSVSDLRRELGKRKLCIVLYQGSGTKKEIASLKSGHYSVVAGIGRRYIYLLDPGVDEDYGDGVGWQKLKISDFKKRWLDKWKENGEEVYCVGWMLSVRPKRKRTRT